VSHTKNNLLNVQVFCCYYAHTTESDVADADLQYGQKIS